MERFRVQDTVKRSESISEIPEPDLQLEEAWSTVPRTALQTGYFRAYL